MRIIISRTDGIGDVILTLPMLGLLKTHIPKVEIVFLNRKYTSPVLDCCEHIDRLVSWDDCEKKSIPDQVAFLKSLEADVIIHVFPRPEIARAAKMAGIAMRIGTTGRLYHIHTCNYLVRFSRKRSSLHEAQLNLKLLKPLKIKHRLKLRAIADFYGLHAPTAISDETKKWLQPDRKNVVLHPLSKGSAVEWGLDNFKRLIQLLPPDEFRIFLTGTEAEGQLFRDHLPIDEPSVIDISGKLDLRELVGFIASCSAVVACSTGPLHIAAALGVCTVGLYTSKRPMHPGRWAPLGSKAQYLVQRNRKNKIHPLFVKPAIDRISPKLVKSKLLTC